MSASADGRAGRVLVLGGRRSGKSAFAERRVAASGLEPVYLATGQAFDGEMERRIAEHRARRAVSLNGKPWRTVEAPLDLPDAIARESAPGRAILVDCLTLWVSNLMLADRDVAAQSERLAAVLGEASRGLLVLVSNEVGLSIVPENAMARAFADHSGRLHQMVASLCDEAFLVAAGLPLRLKG